MVTAQFVGGRESTWGRVCHVAGAWSPVCACQAGRVAGKSRLDMRGVTCVSRGRNGPGAQRISGYLTYLLTARKHAAPQGRTGS